MSQKLLASKRSLLNILYIIQKFQKFAKYEATPVKLIMNNALTHKVAAQI